MTAVGITILGISSIFLMSVLGSSLVYFFKKDISPKLNTLILGFASGIMIAASIWSLLIPSIDITISHGKIGWIPASVGFILGGLFLVLLDKVVPHTHKGRDQTEGPNIELKRSTKLFLAVTIHNIPEGLAVGFAFGAAASIDNTLGMVAALGLAIGISIQNLPEGAAVTLPLRNVTKSRHKAFLLGVSSAAVEPIFATIGYFLAAYIASLQPWLLAFAAGAMIFVVVEDLIPETQISEHSHIGTWALIFGFVLMMILDVALS